MTMSGVAERLRFQEMLSVRKWVPIVALVLAAAASLAGQTVARPGRITQEISSASMVTLRGNVRADLTPQRDLGAVEDGMETRLYMVLQRTPDQQTALDNLLARQQQPTAAEYHKWLTPQQFGAQFGASQDDIAKITNWLESQGMKVNGVMNNATMIDFTASAGRVREVFGTQLHYYNIQGGKYVANAQNPQIPAALAGVVSGIKGLAKIPAKSHRTKMHQTSYDTATRKWTNLSASNNGEKPAYSNPQYTGEYDITPQDYYTIYNVNPVFNGGNLGANATVAVIEESDIEFGTVNSTTHVATGGDVATFRTLFGVPGTLNMLVYHGYGSVTCNAPGIDPNNNGEESEAALDAEWANALAPSATLIFMSCDQKPNGGTDTSMTALIDNNLSDVMSLSYGASELWFVSSDYTFYDTLYSQAASQGQSIIISSGDSGSDSADQNADTGTTEYCSPTGSTADPTGTAVCGVNVSGFSSSPLVTSAGGTDFSDTYDNLQASLPLTPYWGANGTYYNDALKYVPETTWNDSCASSILAAYEGFTGAGLCAYKPTTNPFITGDVIGGSGGFSKHYSVPAYQSGITGYSGTMRAQPDVSMFASNGLWNHALIACDSYVASTSCTSPSTFGAGGGTSFVAPSLAGVGGLLVNSAGRQGVLNPGLYALAKAQFTASATKTACYSNGQTGNTGTTVTASLPANSCIFNDVTTGNNDVPCAAGSTNCFVNSGATYGMLSTTNASSLTVAYPATIGYDAATGIGSLNVANLISKWNTAFTSSTALTASATTISLSQSTTLTATVTGGVPTGSSYTPALNGQVNFAVGSTALGSCTLSGGSCSIAATGSALGAGTNSVTATFVGSSAYPTSTSSIVTVTVTAVQTTTTVTVSPTTQVLNGTVNLTAHVTSTGTPTGTVTFFVGGTSNLGTGTLSSGTATLNNVAVTTAKGFALGSNSITASYGGDSSSATSTSAASTLTVTSLPPATTTVTVAPTSIMQGGSVTVTVTVAEGGPTPTGTVNVNVGSHVIATAATLTSGQYSVTLASTTANGFTVGSNTISATYSGDSAFAGTTGTAGLTVVTAATTTFVTANPTTIALGSSAATASYTATVTGSGSTVPTGTVTFTVGGVTVGTGTLTGGTLTVSGIAPTTAHGYTVGSDTVTATYTPTTGLLYTASSGTVTQTVTAPAYTITPSTTSVSLAPSGSQAVSITLASTTFADTTTWTATTSSGLISVSPASGTAALTAGGNSGAINLTITASGSAANHAPRMPWTGGMIAFGAVLAGIPLARRRKRVAAVLLTALAISTLGFMMACGGSGGGTKAARTYTVTLTGTGGISSVITVTVQ